MSFPLGLEPGIEFGPLVLADVADHHTHFIGESVDIGFPGQVAEFDGVERAQLMFRREDSHIIFVVSIVDVKSVAEIVHHVHNGDVDAANIKRGFQTRDTGFGDRDLSRQGLVETVPEIMTIA